MNFTEALKSISKRFNEEKVDFALIGAFAMLQMGIERATRDIDFLISSEDIGKVEKIMHGLTYQTVQATRTFSQFESPLKVFGNVDFLHAIGKSGLQILREAKEKHVLGEIIKVIQPEDLVGLKVLAYANDARREQADKSDIQKIYEAYQTGQLKLDLEKIEFYYKIFEKLEDYENLWGAKIQEEDHG